MDGIDGPDCRTLTKLFARRTESFYLGNRRPSCRRSRRRLCCAWRASGQPSQPSPSRWGSRCRSGQEPHQDLRLSQRSQHGDLQHLGHLLGLSAWGRDRRDLHRETAVPVLVLLVLGRPQNFSRSPGFLSSSSQSRHGPREQNFHLENTAVRTVVISHCCAELTSVPQSWWSPVSASLPVITLVGGIEVVVQVFVLS